MVAYQPMARLNWCLCQARQVTARCTTTCKGKLSGVGAEEFQDIMEKKLIPDVQQIEAGAGGSFTWLIDNAPGHSAKTTKQFLSKKGIDYCKDWPANSPDLNPIENVWAWMKQKVYSKHYRQPGRAEKGCVGDLVSTARQYVQQLDA